ncbi:MAG TPA: UbiH/UbiF family hydroxylase [Casimicrobiaceae bacterium]|nr:UbiH/UbiF family hydroxylase [Casimicrobiaceae bacterium]
MTARSDYDVLIAGAGLVGLALAAALAQSGLRVALADRAPIRSPEFDADAWDSRVYAISPGSAAFLHGLGAWQSLPPDRVSAVETMHVRGDGSSMLEFSAFELGERALAWIVEESALRAALVPCVHSSGVEVIGDATFSALDWSADAGRLLLADGTAVRARLIVAADGVHSWVREAAGMTATPRRYDQTAVVANFTCERAHHGDARQWFRRDGGVLAWLPLPGRRVSIVWSAPQAEAERLLALPQPDLAAEVQAAGEAAFGELVPLTASRGFPLRFLRLRTPIAHRLALVGDAAHGVHPLAGQGVNLGFGDARALAEVLASRGPVADPGAPMLLARYARLRAEPVLAMQAVTDGLVRLFGEPAPWARALRNFGMTAVDHLPAVKRLLAQPALR